MLPEWYRQRGQEGKIRRLRLLLKNLSLFTGILT
jgi:hypothetical protein